MKYEFSNRDFDSARSGRKRTFSIGFLVTLLTVAAVGYFVWINTDRQTAEEKANSPAQEVESKLPEREAPPIAEKADEKSTAETPTISMPEITPEPEENRQEEVAATPPPTDEIPTEFPEKGKPYVEDVPYVEDQPVRPADLTGKEKAEFESKLADAMEDLGKLQALASEVPENSPSYLEVVAKIGQINMKHFTGILANPKMKLHTVVSGDSLSKIAKAYNVTADSIALSNNITNPNLIRTGQKLRVYPGEWSIKIDKDARVLKLYEAGNLFKLYEIGVGRLGSTPEGEFTIFIRIKDPSWGSIPGGSPDNELGSRYLGLARDGSGTEYGIHGSRDENSVGRSWSGGCIRMRNEDVEELFAIVNVGTPVFIAR